MPDAHPPLEAGTLLVAPPLLQDPNFRRSVVLLCEHNAAGSFGLVLNRPIEVLLDEVMDLSGYDDPLALGGPVQPNTLHFLHRYGPEVPDAVSLAEDVYWGGDFERVKALVQGGQATARKLRFFLGYAGWSAGQLEAELEAGGWITASAEASAVFAEDPATLWRATLRSLGGEYALLANFPDNPRMN